MQTYLNSPSLGAGFYFDAGCTSKGGATGHTESFHFWDEMSRPYSVLSKDRRLAKTSVSKLPTMIGFADELMRAGATATNPVVGLGAHKPGTTIIVNDEFRLAIG